MALVDEATGYQAQRKAGELSFLFRAILRDQASDWNKLWPEEFGDAIVRLHDGRYVGGAHPQWLASTYDSIYRLILGDDVCDEMKRRNPEPSSDPSTISG